MLEVRTRLTGTNVDYYALSWLPRVGLSDSSRLPMTVKILLEMLLRNEDTPTELIQNLTQFPRISGSGLEIPFQPARVLLHDYTGIPAVVDLAAMRTAMQRAGQDPGRINPRIPAHLIIDHSSQVNRFGSEQAFRENLEQEYGRNRERFALLRWAQQSFDNFTLVPPGMGICHQINLEYLSRCVQIQQNEGRALAIPDTLVGTDSHTTMINGLGVLGWGVGGIEAEACMLGQPLYIPFPMVVGVHLRNALPPGATATDLALTLTQVLRKHVVVNKLVEFCGDGLSSLSVADRATLANMCPEYGATAAFFPVDEHTLRYLEMTDRDVALIQLVERYCKEQGLFRRDGAPLPLFSELLELDLASVEPSLAGPRRPQDRVALPNVWGSFASEFQQREKETSTDDDAHYKEANSPQQVKMSRGKSEPVTLAVKPETGIRNGDVVIAAITSCTNTSNPSVMVAAGLLAKKAVEFGLAVPCYVKTSLAPGSRVVTDYLRQARLLPYLERLGFYLVGYGCTTCIGGSGPLGSPDLEATIQREHLNVAAVLSGNRNFEARIHPLVRAAYLASPPLVVAYALAGTVRRDLTTEPIGYARDGEPVFLRDLWPSPMEVEYVVQTAIRRDMFRYEYATIYQGDEQWQQIEVQAGATYTWEPDSTYIREPPFFTQLSSELPPLQDISGARVLVSLGDSITTDHITPAGIIPLDSPAGRYLMEHGVEWQDFNTYGTRRGNYEILARSSWANIHLRNQLANGKEGFWTTHQPSGEEMTIFDAAERYRADGVPLVALAGKEYGSGSSRDSAVKGPFLLGVKAVIAESYERIHRSNLVSMGILPLQYMPGESRESLELSGREEYSIRGITAGLVPGQSLEVEARGQEGIKRFTVLARVDNTAEADYLNHGGVLQMVLRQMLKTD